jgi:hypothetical protein
MPLRPLSILQLPFSNLKSTNKNKKTFLRENYGGFDPLIGYVGKEQNSFNSTKIKNPKTFFSLQFFI